MRVLMIEDDRSVTKAVELMLNQAGFVVYAAGSGEEGIDLAKTYEYDIVMLDLGLPDMSGQRVIQRLRNAGVATPILVLSGDSDVGARVTALSNGADDYMTKPFHKDELIARLRAVVRRAHAHARSVLSIGDLVIDLDTKTASVSGHEMPLTTKEYQVLEALCVRKGMTLGKDTLLSQLYGGMDEPDPKIVDVFICKLRKKLATASGGRQFIRTVWGRGYQIAEDGHAEMAVAA